MRTNPLERTAEVVSLTRETKIPWGDIRTDGGTQARVSINMETVQEYAPHPTIRKSSTTGWWTVFTGTRR